MDGDFDFRIIIYIIAGIIYVITRVMRSNKKKQQPRPRPGQTRPQGQGGGGQGKPPQSFEELLEEFGKGVFDEKKEEKPKTYTGNERRTTVDAPTSYEVKEVDSRRDFWNEPVDDEARSLEGPSPWESHVEKDESVMDDEITTVLSAPSRAYSDKDVYGESEDDITKRIRQRLKGLAEEEEVAQGSKYAREIMEMLQNPDDARKAVIAAEILNPKY